MDENQNKSNKLFTITGNWAERSKELKRFFSNFSTSDLKLEASKGKQFADRIETKLKKKRIEVINMIKKV